MARRDTYVIEFRTVGTARVQRNIAAIGKTANTTRRALAFLRSFLVVFASVQIFAGVFRLADAFTTLNNRLKLLTDDAKVLAALRTETFRLANENRVPVEQFGEILFRVSRATLAMGLNFKELIDITSTVTKAVKLSGSSASSAEAGLVQFAQGLAGASLEGQELASVVEQLPALADIIAREFEKELIDLGFKDPRANSEALGGFLRPLNRAQLGVLNLSRLIKALQDGAEKTADSFGRVDVTIGDAFTQLRNKAILFAGSFNQATGAAQGIIRVLEVIGDNLGIIVLGITAFIGAFTLNVVISQITLLGARIAALAGFLFKVADAAKAALFFIGRIALGIGATITGGLAIVGLIAAWLAWGDAIQATIDRMGGLAGVAKFALAFIIGLVKTTIEEWDTLLKALPAFFGRAFVQIIFGTLKFLNELSRIFIEGILSMVRAGADILSGFGNAIVLALQGEFSEAGKALASGFSGTGEVIGDVVTGVEEGAKAVFDFFANSGENADKFADRLDSSVKAILIDINNLLKSPAFGLTDEQAALLAASSPRGSSNFGIPDRTDPQAASKAQKALDGLLSSISPLIDATLKMAEAEDILAEAIKNKIDLQLPEAEILRRVARETLGAGNAVTNYAETIENLNGELSEHITEAEKAILVNAAFEELAGNFIALEDAVSPLAAATRQYAAAQRELVLAQERGVSGGISHAEILRRTEREIVGVGNATTDYEERMLLLNRALEKGSITQGEFRDAARKTRIEVLEDQRTMAAGIERAMLKIEETYGDTAANVEQAFTTVFQNLEDRLVDFVETGEFNLREFLDTIRQEISRVFIREAIGELSTIFNSVFGNIIPTGGEDPEAAASEALVVAKTNEQVATQAVTAQLTVLGTTSLPGLNTQITGLALTTLPAFTAATNTATLALNNLAIAANSSAAGSGGSAGGGDVFGGLGGLVSSGLSLFSSPNTVGGAGSFGGSNPLETGFSGNPNFNRGGSFIVGAGSGMRQLGNDNRLVPLNLQDGEQVDITPRGGRRRMGGTNVTINVTGAENGDRFKRNQNGVTSRIAGAVSRAEQRNR